MNTYSLQGQAALVTGGDSGIGKGVAIELAKAGAKVVINHVDAHEIAQLTVDEITAAGGEAHAIHADVSSEQEVQNMYAEMFSKYGTIDILVNNAG
ncbi:MAG TPA: SDR family NAD(P)-dependent oxidoreductase, partial [Mucilaginibacter sp.]|nr:SDR family NAD(P)-dependent oxidoreductase [Mucilaginibacter sp.]